MPNITIDNNHIYYNEGVKIIAPSVTQVLNQWVKTSRGFYVYAYDGTCLDIATLEKAGRFGTDIHKAAAYILGGRGVNMDKIDPEYLHCLGQFQDWYDMYVGKVLSFETPLYSEQYQFCGSYDFIGINKLTGKKMLVDFKTAAKTAIGFKMVGAQTAAYKQLYLGNENLRSNTQLDRLVLWLPKTKEKGKYKFEILEGKNDWDYFQYAKYCKAWLN